MMHKGHRERIKNRFLTSGLESFPEHEILELMLTFAIPQKDVNPLAHTLINTFGSFSNVLKADYSDLVKVEGIGAHSATLIKLFAEVSHYYLTKSMSMPQKRIRSIKEAGEFATKILFNKPYEMLYMICLDMNLSLIHYECISEGTLDSTPIYPRKVVSTALKHNAAHIIITHNHPGGSIQPSQSDINATNTISTALDSIDVNLIDHIIVGSHSFYSFAAQNKLKQNLSPEEAYAAQYINWKDE